MLSYWLILEILSVIHAALAVEVEDPIKQSDSHLA